MSNFTIWLLKMPQRNNFECARIAKKNCQSDHSKGKNNQKRYFRK